MPSPPPELRVVIHKAGEQFLAVTQRADTGKEVCQNTFTHDPGKLIHAEPQWMLERVARGPVAALRAGADQANRPSEEKMLIDYGQRLYGYLFGDGAKLKNFFEFAEAYTQQACLTLCLAPDAAALWGLPWEYLHDGTDFLCLTGKLLVHRLPEGLGKLSPVEAAPPLRILVVIASPDDQAELDVERELGVMQDALDDVRRDGLVQIDLLDDATLPALHDALRRQRYHIVHYTGHGVFHKATNHGVLCFENAEGQSDLVGPKEISPLLIDAPDLRVVVLSACQSAKTSGLDAFDS
ncbi:MAG TPA: CHAT domain-containing protein, partial [Anaerolineae bacterium]